MTEERSRYGVKYPDGTFSGEITSSYRLIQGYASEHKAQVYDSHNPDDLIWQEACRLFGKPR